VITFLMTDVASSTRLWETVPRAMRRALARHDEIISDVVESHDGNLVRERGEGDSTFSVFGRATDAAAAALTVQLCLSDEAWPADCPIVIRAALHTGEASERDGDYYGRVVNRTARLRSLAQPGQTLVSESTAGLVLDHLPSDSLLVSLGVQSLKDMDRPERVYLLVPSEQDVAPDGPVDHGASSPAAGGWVLVIGCDRAYHDTIAMETAERPEWDRRVEIPVTRPSTSLGRAMTAAGLTPDIDITSLTGDTGVSRSHAVLEWADDGSLSVVDLSSTNGTYVGCIDEPIAANEPHLLEEGDRIYLGAWTVVEVRSLDGAGPAPG
jgi:class 3 adenylate cyclase